MKKEEKMEKCSEEVYDPFSRRYSPCRNRGKFIRDGKAYCGIHDPVAREERGERKWKVYQEKCKRVDESLAQARRAQDIGARLLALLPTLPPSVSKAELVRLLGIEEVKA